MTKFLLILAMLFGLAVVAAPAALIIAGVVFIFKSNWLAAITCCVAAVVLRYLQK